MVINLMSEADFQERRRSLVESLLRSRYICTERVRMAFEAVPREKFVPHHLQSSAYVDSPLPIGHGQTISAPSMVAIMLERLELAPGQRVLEIGSGSGYNAALLCEAVEGRVLTVERIPELVRLAQSNLSSAGYSDRVEVVTGDGTMGHTAEMPYDRILVTAGAPKIPKPLIDQLAVGGILGIPVGMHHGYQDFETLVKLQDGTTRTKSHGGCAFVPLIGQHGW